jgi:hypothetical protein
MVFSYYKDGAINPTFVYIAAGMKEQKCWADSVRKCSHVFICVP